MGIGSVVAPRRAVFLDRDGVLNRVVVVGGKPYPPPSADKLEIVPAASEVLASLRAKGFLLIVVTNQPDVGRGAQTRREVERIHELLTVSLPLDDVLVCYHEDRDQCSCRKPKPGLLLEAAAKHGIELKDSYLIGDRWRDVDAGRAAGCSTVWIDCGYSEEAPANPSARVSSLKEAGDWILASSSAGLGRQMLLSLNGLRIKIFGDSADKATMLRLYREPRARIHDQPYADAQSRGDGLRRVRPRHPRERAGPSDLV